jgi:hypothetical protein
VSICADINDHPNVGIKNPQRVVDLDDHQRFLA